MYQSKLANFAAAGVSQALINADVTTQANNGRVSAHAVSIVQSLGFELPSKPIALILALNTAQNARPFNTVKGHEILMELFSMAQALIDSGRVKNLPPLVLPEWATSEARTNEAAEKAAKKAEKAEKAEKSEKAEKTPSVTIATLEMIKQQIGLLSDDEKENLLGFLAESLGYQETTS